MIQPFVIALVLSSASVQAGGHVAKGERTFKKCKTCHMIRHDGHSIFRGGRSGPDLYGIIGRQAGTIAGFSYGKSLIAAGDAGLGWSEALLAEYVTDPQNFLETYLKDDGAYSYMSYRLKKGGVHVAAYLASIGPKPGTAQYQTYLDQSSQKPQDPGTKGFRAWLWGS